MNENYNQVPNNDYNQQYAYNDNNGYQREKSTGKNIFIIVLGIIIIILIILLLLKFCGGGGRLTGIKIGNVPIIYVGEKEEIQVSALGTGDRSGTKFNFSLKNESIATLDDDTQTGSEVEATIKGKTPGDTVLTVTAELGNKHFGPEKANVIVCGRLEVEDITDNTITVERGKKKSLKLGLGDNEKCYASLKFEFEDEGIARIVDDDKVEGLEAGTTTLTITDGANGEVEYEVVVIDPNAKVFATGISLSARSLTVCVGGSKTLKATISPSNASDKSVMWSSNKTSVATVSNGRVTGHKVGTAQVTVMTQDGSDKTATANIKVIKCSSKPPKPDPVKVTSITLNPASPSVEVGSTTKVTAGIKPTNATNKTVTCKSENTKIFTVTSSGNKCTIKGVAKGTATLTVTANDGSGVKETATVTVTQTPTPPGPGGCNPRNIDPHCIRCSNSTTCTACESEYTLKNNKCEANSSSTETKNCWCLNPQAVTISGCVTNSGKKTQRDCNMTCRGGTPKWQDDAPACPYTFYNGTCICNKGTYHGTCVKKDTYSTNKKCVNACSNGTCSREGIGKHVCTQTKKVSGSTKSKCSDIFGNGWSGLMLPETVNFACSTYNSCTKVCNAKGYAPLGSGGECTRAN